jgi:hypothetical protein
MGLYMKHVISSVITLIVVLFLTSVSYAQQVIEWQKCFGGNMSDMSHFAMQTKDGGYLFAGVTSSVDGDVTKPALPIIADWIVKLDSKRNIQWQLHVDSNEFFSAIETSDGGYALVGDTHLEGNGGVDYSIDDIVVVKVSSKGTLEWKKTYGGSGKDIGRQIIETGDGYIIAGSTESSDGDVAKSEGLSDAWIIKIDKNGKKLFERTYGDSYTQAIYSFIKTSDGGYAFTGYGGPGYFEVEHIIYPRSIDIWVVKLDSEFNIQWQEVYGGTQQEYACTIMQVQDGGYFILGYTNSDDYDIRGIHKGSPDSGDWYIESDLWAIRLDNSGALLWQKPIGGSRYDSPVSAIQDIDGNYVLAGITSSIDGDVISRDSLQEYPYDILIAKMNDEGTLLFTKCFGGSVAERLFSMTKTHDGKCLLSGFTYSSDGDMLHKRGKEKCDAFLIQLAPTTTDVELGTEEAMEVTISPNPTIEHLDIRYYSHTSSTVRMQLLSVSGNALFDRVDRSSVIGQRETTVDVRSLPSGMYILKLSSDQGITTKKVLISH